MRGGPWSTICPAINAAHEVFCFLAESVDNSEQTSSACNGDGVCVDVTCVIDFSWEVSLVVGIDDAD